MIGPFPARPSSSAIPRISAWPCAVLSGRVSLRLDGVTIEGLTIPNPQLEGVKWDFYAFADMGRVRIVTSSPLHTLSLMGMHSLRLGPAHVPVWCGCGIRQIERLEVTTMWLYVDDKVRQGRQGRAPQHVRLHSNREAATGHISRRMHADLHHAALSGAKLRAAGSCAPRP